MEICFWNPYEYLIDYYMAHKNYQNCFSYYDITEKRNLHSDTLTAKINSILYEYDLGLGRYDEIEEYSNGYAVVINEGKYGYVDHSGNYNIEPTYQYAGAFGRDFGPIQDESGEWYYVDNEGNRRMNYPDDLELEVTKLGYIGNGQYAVGNESTVYFANTDGEIVSGPYQDAGAYNEQRAVVKKDDKCPCLVLYCYLIIKHSRLLSAYGRFYKPDGGCYGKIRPRAGA